MACQIRHARFGIFACGAHRRDEEQRNERTSVRYRGYVRFCRPCLETSHQVHQVPGFTKELTVRSFILRLRQYSLSYEKIPRSSRLEFWNGQSIHHSIKDSAVSLSFKSSHSVTCISSTHKCAEWPNCTRSVSRMTSTQRSQNQIYNIRRKKQGYRAHLVTDYPTISDRRISKIDRSMDKKRTHIIKLMEFIHKINRR